jgi:hypothetical protein
MAALLKLNKLSTAKWMSTSQAQNQDIHHICQMGWETVARIACAGHNIQTNRKSSEIFRTFCRQNATWPPEQSRLFRPHYRKLWLFIRILLSLLFFSPKGTKLTVMVKSIEFLRVMNLNSEPYNSFLYSYKMSFLTFKCQSMISGFLSPRHGVSSGCRWRNRLQYGG